MKQLFKKLKPAYTLATRKAISETLLREKVSKITANITSEMKLAENIALFIDGWTNVRRESIVNIMGCCLKPYYIKSIPTNEEPHTAEYMAKLIENEIQKYEKYPDVEVFGCAAHKLNLIIKDIAAIHYFNSTIAAAKGIVNQINNSAAKLS
ncbi:uncharacterized protein B4U80_14426 [Leptotrombidium deliense]|uniref:DUF659 domain-containing protein n=1 Tax=Leptotrombidium deliense TaxID=299467 RepID=A0A443RWC0_9ACAR|nr:uncharacterized protein B4U80_14426 [Leptotrombidium deliense]